MNEPSRRQFLVATSAGAVAIGAAAVVPVSLANAAEAPAGANLDADYGFEASADSVPVIVSVEDAAAGLLSVMHGAREFTVTDLELTSRITRLAGSEA